MSYQFNGPELCPWMHIHFLPQICILTSSQLHVSENQSCSFRKKKDRANALSCFSSLRKDLGIEKVKILLIHFHLLPFNLTVAPIKGITSTALPEASWHSLTQARTLKALNKVAVAKLLLWKMVILPPHPPFFVFSGLMFYLCPDIFMQKCKWLWDSLSHRKTPASPLATSWKQTSRLESKIQFEHVLHVISWFPPSGCWHSFPVFFFLLQAKHNPSYCFYYSQKNQWLFNEVK